jgi:hypothetical protein
LLDKYPINEVYSARNSETSAFSSSVTQGIPEFLRQQVEYDFSRESEINESPKTAGFTLMSWLLGGGTLLDVLFEVLNDNLRLESEFEERIPSSVVKSLKILSETSLSSFHHVEIGRNLHLEGRADFDLDYWQQAAVTASVGLLFDFSQKESSFIDLVNRAGFVLHITTSNEARPAKQPGTLLLCCIRFLEKLFKSTIDKVCHLL